MGYSYSPTHRSEAASTTLPVDKPMRECVLEGGCPPGFHCPLEGGCLAGTYAAYRRSGLWETIDR